MSLNDALAQVGPSARAYLRPERFLDSPIGRDGAFARLAGGLQFHGGYELIVAEGGRRIVSRGIEIGELPDVLAALPDPVAERLTRAAEAIVAPRRPLQLGERVIRLDLPVTMGILNVTPDSFSDGGAHTENPDAAAEAGVRLAEAGAALIDVGGESTRPGAATVWEGDEIQRVVPVIERLARAGLAVSVDTRKAAVMEAALAAGATLVNDVSALLWDDRAVDVVRAAGCPVVLMHSPDPKSDPHGSMATADPLIEVYDWLEARIAAVVDAGVPRERLLIDPGIGFGKGMAGNLALLNGLALFHGLGVPVVVGASRKRMIGALSNEAPVDQRLGGSLALALKGAELGAGVLRVHDVAEAVQALRVWRGLRDAALSAIA